MRILFAAESVRERAQLRHCPIHPHALRRVLVGGDVQQRLLLLFLHAPILRGGSEEDLLLQLRGRTRVPLMYRALKRHVRNVEPPHVGDILAKSQVAVNALAVQLVRPVPGATSSEGKQRFGGLDYLERFGGFDYLEGCYWRGATTSRRCTWPSAQTWPHPPHSTTRWHGRNRHTCSRTQQGEGDGQRRQQGEGDGQHRQQGEGGADERTHLWPVLSKP